MIIYEEIPNLYPGYQKGSSTDRPAIARSFGIGKNTSKYVYAVNYQAGKVSYRVEFYSHGEQIVSDALPREVEDDYSRTLSNIRECKCTARQEAYDFADLLSDVDNFLICEAWYQGKIIVNGKNVGWQSDFTLSSTWSSVGEVDNYFRNTDNAQKYFNYLESELKKDGFIDNN
jgi:hypothetical protein